MVEHICIRRPNYVAGTSAKPEVGVFTQVRRLGKPSPWGKIKDGETVWMKWSGGPIVAKARVAGFRQLQSSNVAELRTAVSGFSLSNLGEYWSSLNEPFNAIVIYLTDEQWLEEIMDVSGRSYGSSWIVLNDAAALKKWMTKPLVKQSVTKDPRGPRVAGAKLRFDVLRRDSYTCQYCGRSAPHVEIHVDHVKLWSKGGESSLNNLTTACSDCNLGKGNRPATS